MNWLDLKAGDIVIPTDPDSSLWIVLDLSSSEEHPRVMTYLSLGTGRLYTTASGTDGFNPQVQVLRDGENVNR